MTIKTLMAMADGSLAEIEVDVPDAAPPEPTPDEQRDLLLAQLYENQLLMLNGMGDLVVV